MKLMDLGAGGSTKLLGIINLPWQQLKKTFTKNKARSGTAKRLMRDLAIEESLQIEIKYTLAHNNQSYVQCSVTSNKEINKKTR